jgi:putative transposase
LSRPLRLEFPGAVYHVIARGNERRAIFRDDFDRRTYLERLGKYADRFEFVVHAYCLMTNHVHLAVGTGPTRLSRIMLALHGSYSQAFNRRHRRVGHLFQGRYKAFLIQADEHLVGLVRYIHRNPVEAGIVSRPVDYEWSSEQAYRGATAPTWLDMDLALAYFANSRGASRVAYAAFMDGNVGDLYAQLVAKGELIKGDEEFALRVARVSPELAKACVTPERVASLVLAAFGMDVTGQAMRRTPSRLRGIAGYVGREVSRIPLCRMAVVFGKHETTLVKDVRLLEQLLRSDSELQQTVSALSRQAANSGNQR